MLITPKDAAQLLLDRRKARSNMVDYVRYLDLGFVPAKHHQLMCNKLDDVANGEIRRLMLLLPRGAGKSTYGSELFPPYFMGKNPTSRIIACSHTQALADRFGRRTRNLFGSAEHEALFGTGLAADSKAASYWSTDKYGEYFSAGVGVAVTGRRADGGLIDDPTRGREDADSIVAQERAWDWYVSDFYPCLKPGAWQILITTRWHERDLAGRLLEREADLWHIVEIAFEAHENDPLGREIGERLWPEWFNDEDQVATWKADARSWSAMFQQRPISDEGDYFKLNWFPEYDQIPDNVHYYGASDFAVTEGHGDFTEHGIFALDSFGNIYIVDWWRGQTTADIWIEHLCDLIQKYEPLTWFGESGPIRRSVEPYMALRMTERHAPCRIEWLPSISDKATRCRTFQAICSNRKVFLPKISSWKADLLTQLTHFPAGRYDDGVDVCSLLGRGLDKVNAPRMTKWIKSAPSVVHDIHDHAWMVS